MTESINRSTDNRSVSMEGGLFRTVNLQLVKTNKIQRLTGVDLLLSGLDVGVSDPCRPSQAKISWAASFSGKWSPEKQSKWKRSAGGKAYSR